MSQYSDFIRKNILLLGIAFVVVTGYFVLKNRQSTYSSSVVDSYMGAGNLAYDQKLTSQRAPAPEIGIAPQADVANRMVIQNSYLSLLVENVKKTRDEILANVAESGGYMVSSDISGDSESPTGSLVVRVPQRELDKSLATFRSFGIRVVSEHLEGYDVTDQFVDIEKRIAILAKSQSQFQELRDISKEISDITELTQQILNLQSQIDSYRGELESLAKNAEFTKVTVYLSTDELSLPYQPNEPFRPAVIFKLAVRSVMTNVREIIGGVIWIAVYGILWIPLVIITAVVIRLLGKWKKN